MAKLNEDSVRSIKRAYAAGGVTQKDLAMRFGVDHSTICAIVRGKIWRHVLLEDECAAAQADLLAA